MTQRDDSDSHPNETMGGAWILQDGTYGRFPLSDRPADIMCVRIDRTARTLTVTDVNGSPMAVVYCPAVAAGARPEDLQ